MTYYWESYWLHTECFLVGLFDNMLSKGKRIDFSIIEVDLHNTIYFASHSGYRSYDAVINKLTLSTKVNDPSSCKHETRFKAWIISPVYFLYAVKIKATWCDFKGQLSRACSTLYLFIVEKLC